MLDCGQRASADAVKVCVVYCFPQVQLNLHYPLAEAFARTWKQNAPGYPCTLTVGINGGNANLANLTPFSGTHYRTMTHDNTGWDIGLFQRAADTLPCDLLVCLGAHIQFHHEGWLKRLVDAYAWHGPGLYGPWGADWPTWHIRTTAFACPPELIVSYPMTIGSSRQSRYQFEHGQQSITRHTMDAGMPAVMVTMRGAFPFPYWKENTPTPAESILLDKQHR